MAIRLDIHKKLGEFELDIHMATDSRRIGILGASGCGKSMTLKCIAGIERPDSGFIQLGDRVLYDSAHKVDPKPQKRNVGYLFQNYALFPTMTVHDNIAVGIRKSRQEKEKTIKQLIGKFQLEGLEGRYPAQLSGGQQQRVALARIMAYEPDVILLDEPFSALDIYLKEQLQHELSDMLSDYQGTVIMVSHSRDEIYRFSEVLMVMDQGKNVSFGKTKDVFDHPDRKAAARLTGCQNIVPVIWEDAHTLSVPGWKMTLDLKQEISDEIRYIGIRSEDFIPVFGEKKANCVPVFSARADELPSEMRYYIKTGEDRKEEICWVLPKRQEAGGGLPDHLYLPEDKILLLKE